MKITVKCPNCHKQVPEENRFCIYCGCDLSRLSTDVTHGKTYDEPLPPADDDGSTVLSDPDYTGPCFCPKGHDVLDPSLGFCSICGSPLVDEPSADKNPDDFGDTDDCEPVGEEVEEPEDEPAPVVSRKCRCGYICDDPELNFCPSCGMPFDSEISPSELGWICVCGEKNPLDMSFCSACGKSKKYKEDPPEEPIIPGGMKPPTEYDLLEKASYK